MEKDDDKTLQGRQDVPEQPAVSGEVIEDDLSGEHSRVVEHRTVEHVMEDSFLRYSMSVIVDCIAGSVTYC